jgi:hypothetical protein
MADIGRDKRTIHAVFAGLCPRWFGLRVLSVLSPSLPALLSAPDFSFSQEPSFPARQWNPSAAAHWARRWTLFAHSRAEYASILCCTRPKWDLGQVEQTKRRWSKWKASQGLPRSLHWLVGLFCGRSWRAFMMIIVHSQPCGLWRRACYPSFFKHC